MKTLNSAIKQHLRNNTTTLATCWMLTRTDNVVMVFTDHQADLVVSGQTYRATSGFTASSIATSSGLAVDNLEIHGLLAGDEIREADILQGKYDFATITIFLVNYKDPDQGILVLRKGTLGEVQLKQGAFYAEMRGLSQVLQQNIIEVYSPDCRANLGDSRCKYDLAGNGWPSPGGVAVATSRRTFSTNLTQEDSYFDYAKMTWLTGLNAGYVSEILYYQKSNGTITLFLPTPKNVTAGDTFNIQPGCDKQFSTCRNKFSNGANFRGEPHIPTGDQALQYPNSH